MISNKDLRVELDKLEKVRNEVGRTKYEEAMLKSQELIIKLLANMRTNQTLGLQGSGIDLVPRRIESEN